MLVLRSTIHVLVLLFSEIGRALWQLLLLLLRLLLLLLLKCQDYSVAITQYYRSTQTSADGLNGQRQVSRMTGEKVRRGLPSEFHEWGEGPSLWWQTVPRPRCSHRKGAVAKGSPTSRRRRRHSQSIVDIVVLVERRQRDRSAADRQWTIVQGLWINCTHSVFDRSIYYATAIFWPIQKT